MISERKWRIYPRFEQKDKSKENAYFIFQRKKQRVIFHEKQNIGILLKGCYLIYLDLLVCVAKCIFIYNS